MPTFAFDHIALSVKDVNASVAFYQRVLGLKEIENTASVSKTRWLSLNEHKELHLIPRPAEAIKTSQAVHFALTTSDVRAFASHLTDLGVPFVDWKGNPATIQVRDDGILQVYFKDPDGYWIEVNDARQS